MQPSSAEEIFLQASELPESERQKFIADSCGADLALLGEVAQLEGAEATFDDALRNAIGNQAECALARRRIGPYQLVKSLGEGGMGSVYLAVRDDDEYRKEVAIKVSRAAFATAEALARFRHERQILASLEHPNIARLLEGGTGPDGEPYIVMEYVAGVSIVTYCQQHGLDVKQKLNLVVKVAAGVDYANRHLVVHRDLKPSNILVDAEGEPKLLDFGIAKMLGGEANPAMTTTPLLTPDYSSPEQLQGTPVSAASDVYSLGLVLCELLIGKPVRSESLTLPKSLRGDLETILRKALRQRAADRYSTVREFAGDIRRFLEGRPIQARPPTVSYLAGKFLRRHRAGVAAALLLLLSVAAGTWATWRQARRTEMRFAQVRQLANVMLFDLHDRIGKLPGSTGTRAHLVQIAQDYLASLEPDTGSDPLLAAEIAAGYERLGDVQGGVEMASVGRVGAAVESYRKALGLRESLARGGEPPALRALAVVRVKAANALAQRGASAEALGLLRQAVHAGESAWRGDPADRANGTALIEAEYRLGDWLLRKGRAREALPHAAAGLAVARILASRDPNGESRRVEWMALRRLGDAAHQAGRLEEAAMHFSSAEAMNGDGVKLLEREAMLLELAQGNVLGNPLFLNLGDRERAGVHYRRALNWAEQRAHDDPYDAGARADLAVAISRLASTLWDSNPSASARLYDRSIAIRTELLRVDPDNVEIIRVLAYDWANSAQPWRRLGQPAEAADRARRALALDAEVVRRDPVRVECCNDIPMYAVQLGDALLDLKRLEEARLSYQQAVTVAEHYGRRETCGVFCTKDWATALEKMARWNSTAGKPSEARQWAVRSLAVWRDWATRNGSNVYIEKRMKEVGSLLP